MDREPEREFYGFLGALDVADLPSGTAESAAALVLDHLRCTVGGMSLPWTRYLVTTLSRAGELDPTAGGSGDTAVYGSRLQATPMTAALITGTAAHGLDIDDTHLPTMSHPGSVVIPAAFAAAQTTEADGRSLLGAVVAGYEAMIRVARAVGLGHGEKGFHATGQLGPAGSAVAAARILAGDAAAIGSAVGSAASFGGGIKAFVTGPGMVKRLHTGRAARAGLFAALLATSGFDGPRDALTSRFGLIRTMSMDIAPDLTALTAGLGESYAVDETYLKPYGACAAVHGAMRAAADIAPLPLDDIDRVVVGTSRRAVEQNRIPEPADVMAAQYSTEYAVALTLLGGADDAVRFLDAETGADDAVRQVARRVTLEVDAEAEAVYPDANAARVQVWTAAGEHLSARAAMAAANSRGLDVAREAFVRGTASTLSSTAQDDVIDAVAHLAQGGPVHAVLSALDSGLDDTPIPMATDDGGILR